MDLKIYNEEGKKEYVNVDFFSFLKFFALGYLSLLLFVFCIGVFIGILSVILGV